MVYREPVDTELQRLAEHDVRNRNAKIKVSDRVAKAGAKVDKLKHNKPELGRRSEN